MTHSASDDWRYGACRDTSGPPVYAPTIPTLLVSVELVQEFDSAESAEACAAWKRDFFASNTRDVHQNTTDSGY